MSSPGAEFVELFLQEASEHLQYLREYAGILLDPYPAPEEMDRLYLAAHTLKGSSAMYGYLLFAEVSAKLAHIFQYAMNVGISEEAAAPLVEFISEAVAVLESDLLMINDGSVENEEEIGAFRQKYPFAFQQPTSAAEPEKPQPEAQQERSAVQREPEPQPDGSERPFAVEALPSALEEFAIADGANEAATAAASTEVAVAREVSPVEPTTPMVATEAPLAAEVAVAQAVAAEQSLVAPRVELAAEAPLDEPFTTTNDADVAAENELSEPPKTVNAAANLSAQPNEIELPPDGDVPAEILEFFVPEAEEHLQAITECLLALEANSNSADVNRLFRAIHTIKGSAAQVGLPRIALVAHRTEDLIGKLRDGELKPSAAMIDLCLDAVDALKKFVYRQWTDEAVMRSAVTRLLARIERMGQDEQPAPEQQQSVAPVLERAAEIVEIKADVREDAETHVPPAVAAAPDEAKAEQEVAAVAEGGALASEAETATVAAVATTSNVEVPVMATAAEAAAPAKQRELSRMEASAQQPAAEAAEAAEIEAALVKQTGASLPQSKSVRIGLERLDLMMNAVGELVINRTRMLGRLAELEKLADVLNFSKARMSDKIVEFQDKYEFSRLHAPAAEPVASASFPYRGGYSSYSHSFDPSLAEFSELEMDRYDDFSILSRSMTEISADITEILTQLDTFVRRVDSDIDEFTKLAHRLQDEITAARMVPIGNLYTRISRTVRDAAKAAGKQVELELAGAETELDNNIIQQMADPLLHLVRNAVAHGIEGDEERYNAGKSDHGKVSVRAYHRGNHIYIEVEDDGRGIEWDHVRATAVNLGVVAADDAPRLTERDLHDLLFHPGFSTAPRKSELAGRGVGLDVVKTNLDSLNGEVEIETQKGFGTRFTLKVPLTLIISQALFVRCGQQLFAFPLAFVEEIRRIRDVDMEDVGGKLLTKVRDVVTEVVRLDQQLGIEPIQPVNGFYRLVIVNVAGRQVGIVVEEVLRKDEIVIKNLGEYLRNVKLFPGATIAPDGRLIMLVDVNRLIAGESIERRPLMTAANAATARIFAPGALAVAHGEIPPEAIDPVGEEKVVVLADDSISVRKFVGRMLEKAGYRVKLAADGLDALEIVTQTRCDLVVTDLEMPRTNGYELMAHLRQNPDTRGIPVMVVTSRAGEKHREKAMKQGAADFLVKPVQEEQFIAAVATLIGGGTGAPRAKAAVV